MSCFLFQDLQSHTHTHLLLASLTYPMRSHRRRKPMSSHKQSTFHLPCYILSTVLCVQCAPSQAEKYGPIMEVYKTPRLSALSSTPVVLCFHSLLHISASPFPSIYRILGPNSQYQSPSAHPYIWLAPPSFHKAKPLDCV
ncbi:uncharacterized protein B0T23DRAFT_172105 [Neurospora hispaniola]|uniref:Uncharacterized protein n=1 Tax=Neurospora hispaniola TaxID=588809 RepID=A0AAJ0MQW4_9PEZI|nr:hypothetical protein B0T23DRAFT_172105 [Neurospora hispaniola]